MTRFEDVPGNLKRSGFSDEIVNLVVPKDYRALIADMRSVDLGP